MANKKDLERLLDALTRKLSDNELLMASLQADIAAAIAERRVELKLSQKDLANKLNVSQSMISKIEKGDCNYQLQTLVNIALALNIAMRSPFVNKASASRVYRNNIIAFPASSWSGSRPYSPSSTDYTELKEM